MKFVVSSSLLSSRLQTIGRVIVSKNNLPILDSFLFSIKDSRLTLTASDNEITLTTWIDLIESESDVSFVVNAKTIQDAMKEIPEQPLAFYVNSSNLEITVQYQNGEYHFMGQSADDYPLVSSFNSDDHVLRISAQPLLAGVSRALFATADDTLRPVMNGVLFDMTENDLTLVASDGHKLACDTLMGVQSTQMGRFILPKKPAMLLKAILSKEQGEVVVKYGDSNAYVETDSYQLSCRLIEGRYPNYNSVIPQENPNRVTINRAAFISALRRVLVFSNANSALVKLRLDLGRITISSQDIDFSMSAEETLLCDYSGIPLSIGFKGTFLMELLSNLDSEEIDIKLSDGSRAGIIVPTVQNDSERILMLLMPMMLND